jgi:hypothetical protein
MTITTSSPATSADSLVPVSLARLHECLESATFWTDELPKYANRNQQWADFWAILAGLVAAITSLAIWPVLSGTSSTSEKVAISGAALLTAVCALFPRVKNYAERAGAARELTTRYAGLKGRLIDVIDALTVGMPFDHDIVRLVVEDFQSTKERKDSLRALPDRAKAEGARAEPRPLPPPVHA